jgi:UDP-hydrolysing UDP-N-acetyl-D-glucosamine 2-epimerase
MKKRKICIFTGTRAEYGLLKPLIDELMIEKSIELQLIVSGMHLSPEFGLTHKEISLEGFSEVEKVEILLSSDTPIGVSKAMGLGMISFAETLDGLKPDLLVVLGDRSELFALASAALVQNIPIAHIHGGEVTSGAYDDAFRHSITKMSHIHFAATEIYKKRIIQLGEDPKTVFDVGALGLDNIKRMKLLSKRELQEALSIKLDKPFFIVTFHPVTLENNSAEKQTTELLNALEKFVDYKIIFTKPNSDNDGRVIIKLIDEFVDKNIERSKSFNSIGQLRYLSALKYAEIMIGNSSSGIIEMPFFNKPTINIGDRQKGRIFPKSVIQCEPNVTSIVGAVEKGLDKRFRKDFGEHINIYGNGHTAKKIKKILLKMDYSNIIKKDFYDL